MNVHLREKKSQKSKEKHTSTEIEGPASKTTDITNVPTTLPAAHIASAAASSRNVPTLQCQAHASTRERWVKNSRNNYFNSDNKDPDDPNSDETSQPQLLNQSAYSVSQTINTINPDLGESALLKKKSRNFFEPVPKIVHCPCCNFSTVLESLLRDHYVASHKHETETSCLVCNSNFEHIDLFIQHFYVHEKDMILIEEDVSECSSDSSKPENIIAESKAAEKEINASTKFYKDISPGCVLNTASEVLPQNIFQIPRQTAIQGKLAKESKVKSFEDLKSNTAVVKMQSKLKLKRFFKCTILNCTFTADDGKFYLGHLNKHHKHKKLHCTYCFQEFFEAQFLIKHMLQEHIKCCYQCSVCFYRAVSKPHVQIHIRNNHKTKQACVYSCNLHLRLNYSFPKKSTTDVVTTKPYICAVGDCKYQSFYPKEFTKHTDLNHQNISQLPCHYCQHDFLSVKELVSHYQLHDINTFQCKHCVHGFETKEEILLHICNAHADKPFKIFVRDSQQVEFCKTPINGIAKQNPLPVAKVLPKKAMTVEQDEESLSSLSLFQRNGLEYPEEVLLMDKYFFCRMPSCKKECQNFDTYFNHLKEDHSALNILCPYCFRVYEDSTTFEKHLMCHGPNLYACPLKECTLYSFLKSSIVEHLKNDHKIQSEIKAVREDRVGKLDGLKLTLFPKSKLKAHFSCLFCYYKTTDLKLMRNHIYAEFFYKPCTCNVCKDKTCYRNETETCFAPSHQHQDVQCEGTNNLEIEFLTNIFLTSDVQSKFVRYLQSKDMGDKDILCIKSEYKCDECNLCYKDIANWHYHWVDCVSKEYRPNTCSYCGEQFSYVNQLKHHTEKVHAGHRISYTLTENILLRQTTLRKLQFRKLQILKSVLIPYLKSKNLYCEKLNSFQLDFKWHSNLNDKFPCSDRKHNAGYHEDKSLVVSKVQNSADIPKNCNDQSKMMSLNSCAKAQAENEPFFCTFCNRNVQTIDELEQHVASFHDVAASDSYSFYYFPDAKLDYSEKDAELYECAYCDVSQKNLSQLKWHCVNLHSGVPFKVRGKCLKDSPSIQCKHCNLKVISQEELEKHCSFHHFEKSTKSSENDKQQLKRKGAINLDGPSNKLLKGNSSKYQCGYCKDSFPFYIQMITHHKAEHRDMILKFTKGSSIQLILCDFCPYLAEECLMTSHLLIKHKNCFVCPYCGRGSSEICKIGDHIKTQHPHLPIKLVKVDDLALPNASSEDSTCFSSYRDKSVSNFGCRSEPIDMHNITVNISANKSSTSVQLPIAYLFQIFPMFPFVLVEDIAKPFVPQ